MDVFGRRRLLLVCPIDPAKQHQSLMITDHEQRIQWTLPVMAVVMALASLTFSLPSGTTQLCLLAALIYLFCALYSPGVGPVPVAYSAEIVRILRNSISNVGDLC
jgi:hypothetical protein